MNVTSSCSNITETSTVAQDTLNGDEDDITMEAEDICHICGEQGSLEDVATNEASDYAIRALGETIRTTLFEINKVREQNQERRHREILDVLNQIIKSNLNQCNITTAAAPPLRETERRANGDRSYQNEANSVEHEAVISRKTDSEGKKYSSKEISEQEENRPVKPRGDITLMRRKLLEMQRKKMEDRERKKRFGPEVENV